MTVEYSSTCNERRRLPVTSNICIDDNTDDDNTNEKELHIAPMLDFSKREFRKLFSILSTKMVLWTDMVVDETIAHSNKIEDILGGDYDITNKQVCQIGGNSPMLCGKATQVIEENYPCYDEINLNIDCPSDRVSLEREFGAILMKKADVAYDVLQSMSTNAKRNTPISVKCRVGVDDWDDLEFIDGFIRRLQPVCRRFVLHARKCVLNGLYNARQNRSIPPLNFPRVYEICHRFPDCEFWINGGIRTLIHAKDICYNSSSNDTGSWNSIVNHGDYISIKGGQQYDHHHQVPCTICNSSNGSCTAPPYTVPTNLRGCMMGRAAIDNPALFADVDRYFYGLPKNPCTNRRQVLEKYCNYLEELYPRRCCDVDDRITYKLPVPIVDHVADYCPICQGVYINDDCHDDRPKRQSVVVMTTLSLSSKKNKISSRIIGRSFKPIRGMFYGVPNGKMFLAICDKFGKDLEVRNCGPGYILRRVLKEMPKELLDKDFDRTEDCSNKYH